MFEKYKGKTKEKLLELERDMPKFDPFANQDLSDKCCRLGFLQTRERIVHVFNVHGVDIEVFDATFPANEDLGEPDEPEHGFLMKKHKEGYPCDALKKGGCKFGQDEKPWSCKIYPTYDCPLIETCSFEFDEEGTRTGECNRCK